MASAYTYLTNTTTYSDYAHRWLANILGANAWGTSLIVSDGLTFPVAFLVDERVRSISKEPALADRDLIKSLTLHGLDRIAPQAGHRTSDNMCHLILTPSHPPSRRRIAGDYSCTRSTAGLQNPRSTLHNTCCLALPDNCNPDVHTFQSSSGQLGGRFVLRNERGLREHAIFIQE